MKKIFSIGFILCSATGIAQNVGVGEANPTEGKLQVKSADSAVLLLHNSNAAIVDVKTAQYFKTGNFYSGGIATIGTGGTFRMGLFTYGGTVPSSLKERITILDAGNVGIGAINPGYMLDINGRARLRYNGNTPGIWYNKADNTEGAFVGMVNDTTYGFWGNGTSGNWKMGFDVKNAQMGIGIADPSAPLSFASSVGNKIALWGDASGGHYGLGIQGSLMQLYSSASSADIAFGYGSSGAFTENMRVKGNGNVGIGTNNPTAKLEVAGTLKIADGTQGVGKVLTSDASGNASWKAGSTKIIFSVFCPSNQIIVNQANVIKLPFSINDLFFGNTSFNIGNGYNDNTDEFVVPEAGVYSFTFNLDVNQIPSEDFSVISYINYNNGSAQYGGSAFVDRVIGNHTTFSHTVIYNLQVGDKVFVSVGKSIYSNGANFTINGGNNAMTTFSGFKIN